MRWITALGDGARWALTGRVTVRATCGHVYTVPPVYSARELTNLRAHRCERCAIALRRRAANHGLTLIDDQRNGAA